MMNKSVLYILRIFFLIMFLSYMPLEYASAASNSEQTLGGLRQALKDLQAKQAAQNNKKTQTKNEIQANVRNKEKAENELEETKVEIAKTEEKIVKTEEEISKLKSQMEELIVTYQKLTNENIYLSYVTGAGTVTEMLMRIEAVNRIIESNKQKLDEMETLIKNNEKMNKQLDLYQEKLEKNIVTYEAAKERLTGQLEELEEGAVTIQDEINNTKKQIQALEDLGCKENQTFSQCYAEKFSSFNNNGWLKPLTKGRITSLYGKRTAPTAGASTYHKGIDIGVSEGTKVYPTANGVVGAIVERSSCGGNMLYIWVTVNGKQYTTVFMHLLEIKVKVGDPVTVNQVVALSGGGAHTASKYGGYDRCTTGAHLHYGLASGGWYGSSKSTPLSSFNSHTMNPPGFPGLYQWFYSRN